MTGNKTFHVSNKSHSFSGFSLRAATYKHASKKHSKKTVFSNTCSIK